MGPVAGSQHFRPRVGPQPDEVSAGPAGWPAHLDAEAGRGAGELDVVSQAGDHGQAETLRGTRMIQRAGPVRHDVAGRRPARGLAGRAGPVVLPGGPGRVRDVSSSA